jgi:hypothetical protein
LSTFRTIPTTKATTPTLTSWCKLNAYTY